MNLYPKLGLLKIFIFFYLRINLCDGSNICQTTKIGIYDRSKFPDSSFSHYRELPPHKAFQVRISPNGPLTTWHTYAFNDGWVQVDLGFYFILSCRVK